MISVLINWTCEVISLRALAAIPRALAVCSPTAWPWLPVSLSWTESKAFLPATPATTAGATVEVAAPNARVPLATAVPAADPREAPISGNAPMIEALTD